MFETARDLLSELSRRGVKLEATTGGKLRYAPLSEVDADTLGQLRVHKQALLELLAQSANQPRFVQRERERAAALGLVAKWSREFDYISIHDPTTGEWHNLHTKAAPAWAKWEAGKRKELRRCGVAHMLTATEMEKLWEEEHPKDPFVDDALPDNKFAVTERGIV